MELSKFERQLQLMLLLTQNQRYTIQDLMEKLEMSQRSIYRYLEFFKDFGFQVERKNGIYRLDKSSDYFHKITELIHFSDDEAQILKTVLEGIPQKTVAVKQLLHKLSRIYNLELNSDYGLDEKFSQNQKALYKAIQEKRQVLLKDYSSGHSQTVSDRLIEPFDVMSAGTEIRAYEISSSTNKTFKITRMGEVILQPDLWGHVLAHKKVYRDTFNFSGEDLFPVKLRLTRTAVNLLKEEFFLQADELVQEDTDHWIYTTQVCSFVGVGRFVMGLLGDVEILESPALRDYIRQKIAAWMEK